LTVTISDQYVKYNSIGEFVQNQDPVRKIIGSTGLLQVLDESFRSVGNLWSREFAAVQIIYIDASCLYDIADNILMRCTEDRMAVHDRFNVSGLH